MVDPGEGTSWVSKKMWTNMENDVETTRSKAGKPWKKTQKKHGDPKV
jgi:hypothetical protein